MSLRMPRDVVEVTDRPLSLQTIDLDWLASIIREANEPVPIEVLVREAIRAAVVQDRHLRAYLAGQRYSRGERLRLLDGRLGDIVRVDAAENEVQGAFDIVTMRLQNGEFVRMAAGVADGPKRSSPDLVSQDAVDAILGQHEREMIHALRQALASDPRFITLYHKNEEYGCLREFFPPMSPDVLDAALALLLDELFEQIPIHRITQPPKDVGDTGSASGVVPAKTLFSADYLDATLPHTVAWTEDAEEAFDRARALWTRAAQQGDGWDAAQTERAFVQPLLRALGWATVPLPESPSVRGRDRRGPGAYALCADEVACAELYIEVGEGDPVGRWALALSQSTSWGRPLDQPQAPSSTSDGALTAPPASPGAAMTASGGLSVPAHRILADLRRTEVRWGIVTNGRVWRLVNRDANSVARAFYEVDLGTVFDHIPSAEDPDEATWEQFKRWWLLFRQASYETEANGECWIDQLRYHSPIEAGKVHDLLRNRLLGVALPAIAGGFVAYRHLRSGIPEETAVSLQQIYRASVILLTRLIFVLAAEARGLLPLDDPDYRPHSLRTQAQWAIERVRMGLPLSSGVYTTPRYDLLMTLFHRISRGDGGKGLPYYGSLFFSPTDDEDHAFLDQYRLSDHVVAVVLDALLRDIDYAALDARDLSRVCRVLLGRRFSVTDPETGDLLVAGREETARTVLPDYVVTGAVEHALVPVLDAHNERFVAAMERVVRLRRKLQHALDRDKRARLYADWEAAAREARQAFLGIRVCDPEMGTGDFLVSAVDVLTDRIIERLQAYHDAHPDVPRSWNPLHHLVEEVRTEILEEITRQGVNVDARKLDDATILSRLIAQRCVFGVTPNAMAVEIATVGLWLHTFTLGAPFIFLKHHLQPGNALLGVDVADFDDADVREFDRARFDRDILAAAGMLYPVTERVDTTPLDVRWSAGQYGRVQENYAPYRRLLDLWLTAELGDADAWAAWQALTNDVPAETWPEALETEIPAWVEMQSQAEGFFHWELAFPEVFVDLADPAWLETSGFDAVVGSPPWTTASDERLLAYYRRHLRGDRTDLDVHQAFLALARRLTRPGGQTSFVLSRQWLARPTGGI